MEEVVIHPEGEDIALLKLQVSYMNRDKPFQSDTLGEHH